jgi:hypothetical protein
MSPLKAKRLRLSEAHDEGAPTATTTATNTHPPPIPTLILSSPLENAPPAAGNQLPSFAVLFDELCKIAGNKYGRDEALTALVKISGWVSTKNGPFLQEFHEIGGIPHVLNFLKLNMSDMECVNAAAGVLTNCSYRGINGENCVVADAMAQQVVKRDGIHLLLLANDECTDFSSLLHVQALRRIWKAVRNVISKNAALLLLSEEQICAVLDCAIHRLHSNAMQIQNKTLGQVILVLHIIVRGYCSPNHTVSKTRPLVQNCLGALKRAKMSTENIGNSLSLFVSCSIKKLISNRTEFESIIPFCILSIEKNPNNTLICESGLILVHEGFRAGIQERFLEEAGIHRAVGAVLQDSNAEESVEQRTRGLMKALYLGEQN